MNNPTAQPISPATEKSNPANRDRTAQGAPGLALVKFPDPIQGKLPIRPDAKRGSERIRARAYRDPRLTGNVMLLVLAISEFVTGGGQPVAKLKIATICKWTHGKDWATRGAVRAAVELGVLAVDRKRTYQRYVFLDSWLDWFGAMPEPLAETAARDSRSVDSTGLRSVESTTHDRWIPPITGEPVLGNTQQQQQQGCETEDEDPPARPVLGPTPAQIRGILDMARELREDAPAVNTRAEASDVFRELKRRVSTRRTKTNRDAYAARQERHRQYHDYAGRLRELRQQDNAGGDA